METFIWLNSYSEHLREHPFLMCYVQMPKLQLQLGDILNTVENKFKNNFVWMKIHSIYLDENKEVKSFQTCEGTCCLNI